MNASMNDPVVPWYRSTWFVLELATYRLPSGPVVIPRGEESPPLLAVTITPSDAPVNGLELSTD